MKRLKYFLLHMENPQTFHEIYDGRALEPGYEDFIELSGRALEPGYEDPIELSDPTYWHEDIAFTYEQTHKHALDRPTVTIAIPLDRMGVSIPKDGEKAAADFCLRALKPYIDDLNAQLHNRKRTDKENGRYILYTPGSEVLIRNAAFIAPHPRKDYVNGNGAVICVKPELSGPPKPCLCIRMQVQFPHKNIKKTMQMLCKDLPQAISLFADQLDKEGLDRAIALSLRQERIRAYLRKSEFCAFLANGSILPRHPNGGPLPNAVPFIAPPGHEITMDGVTGLGIRRGVTVITGGGYSGKSTVLDAIAAGIYDHIEGDGRELVITDDTAVSIAAEDGRSVQNVNVSPFIRWIPGGNPEQFTTSHASGSTSQAANIMEAVEAGSRLLLIDEDKTATNFMIRDKSMRDLVQKEPICPFTDRANELFSEAGVSTILVIGGSGEYLTVANQIYLMDDFRMQDTTQQARQVCAQHGIKPNQHPEKAHWENRRKLAGQNFTSYPENSGTERLKVTERGFLLFGSEQVDLRGLANIATTAQQTALAFILRHWAITNNQAVIDPYKALDELYSLMIKKGIDMVYSSFFTECDRFLDLPRKMEVLFALFRMRWVRFGKQKDDAVNSSLISSQTMVK